MIAGKKCVRMTVVQAEMLILSINQKTNTAVAVNHGDVFKRATNKCISATPVLATNMILCRLLRISSLQKIFVSAMFLVIYLITSICMAQDRGGVGGGNKLEATGTSKTGALQVKASAHFGALPIFIDIGTPEVGTEEGIYIWLDETKTWQVRWQGEPGKLVWLRLITENAINDVASSGNGVKTRIDKSGTLLTLTGATTSDISGVSFKSDTPLVTVDAKWDMQRNPTKLEVSALKSKPASLPFGITASVYKDIVPSITIKANEEKGISIEPDKSGGQGSSGHGK